MSPRESDKLWPMSTRGLRSAMARRRHVRFPRESDKSWPMSTRGLRSAMVLMRHVRFPVFPSGFRVKFTHVHQSHSTGTRILLSHLQSREQPREYFSPTTELHLFHGTVVETHFPDCGHSGVWAVEKSFPRVGFHEIQGRFKRHQTQRSQPVFCKLLQRLFSRR